MNLDDVRSGLPATLDLLTRRASALQFVEPGPTEEQLQQMLTAAVTAADHGRLRPWRFVVFLGSGRERLGDLMEEQLRDDNQYALDKDLDKARAKALRAPLVIALICKPTVGHKVPVIEQHSAAAAAGAHLMLAANALGFGAAWKTGAAVYHSAVRTGLGLGDDDTIVGLFYIGSEAQPSPLPRATLESVVQYQRGRAG
jgi:nitroreductase